ncbi:MAG: CmcJ/NvfI family oxidoreductase [Janthinobacterium lividum]
MPIELVTDFEQPVAESRRTVQGHLQFTERTGERPYAYVGNPPEGVPQTRGEFRSHAVQIEDARPIAQRLNLDVEGVAVARRASVVADFWDEAQTLALGHPETAQLVKDITGASRVVVFDHTRRRREEGAADRAPDVPRQPATRAHVDQTIWSGPKRVREIMGAQADALLTRRAAIINVWRPIAHAARDWPLAVGDARSIEAEDLIASDLIFPHRTGQTYGVAFNPAQRWLYIPDLQVDEALLIKCWDSDASVARFAPHTAFEDATTPPGTPPRQSIEFRTIAFFD